ncbi:MAG TPA: class I SAM-dependent methyltransferase [Nitrososphaeraceae archaeon]|nr:class I SAM-dependent methyltransferase [Nitrososphaeraceae archaeon]
MKIKSKPNDLNNIVLKVLAEIEETARKEFLPSIGPIKGKIIEDVIREHKPRKVLEIGTLHGYSAILIANIILGEKYGKENFASKDGGSDPILISMEKDQKLAKIARMNIENSRLSKKIQVIDGDALEVIPRLKSKFNMIFLDATKSEYLKYLQLIEKYSLLNKRAVVVADNVLIYENEMKDYLDYVRNSGKYISRTTETTLEFTKNVKDALEVSINVDI